MGKNITQQEVADAVGVSQPTVGRWLQGKAIDGADLLKLATFFSVSPFTLMGDEPLQATALRETPAEYRVDDLLMEIKTLKEQVASVERAAKRLKP